jgi:hypothetical protein
MEKTKLDPMTMCLIVTLVAVVGMIIGLLTLNPLWLLFLLLPTVGYEVYRTQEGATTKFSSIVLLILLVLEIILILFGINYNLAQFFGTSEKYVAGYYVPLGDVQVFGPILMGVLSAILVFRTYGKYTKWLSIVIAVSSLVAVFLISPNFLGQVFKVIVNGLFDRLASY